jgi:hypothetical protein
MSPIWDRDRQARTLARATNNSFGGRDARLELVAGSFRATLKRVYRATSSFVWLATWEERDREPVANNDPCSAVAGNRLQR